MKFMTIAIIVLAVTAAVGIYFVFFKPDSTIATGIMDFPPPLWPNQNNRPEVPGHYAPKPYHTTDLSLNSVASMNS